MGTPLADVDYGVVPAAPFRGCRQLDRSADRARRSRGFAAIFMLDRALRELDDELNNRPDLVSIPVSGLVELPELA
jgi:predicted trehalose synthase